MRLARALVLAAAVVAVSACTSTTSCDYAENVCMDRCLSSGGSGNASNCVLRCNESRDACYARQGQ